MAFLDFLFRFLLTFLMAFIFGIERQRAHKPVGFGTYIFVSAGSCGLAITSLALGSENPLPLLGAIVTGIGFLGAGALLKTTDKIFGFTTAASIWLFAILGLVIGVGEYEISVILYAIVWAVLFFDRYLEKRGIGAYQKKLVVTTNRIVSERDIRSTILSSSTRCKMITIDINKKDNKLAITYLAEGMKENINQIPQKLYEKDWFESCRVE